MPDYQKLNAAIDSYCSQSYGADTDGGELSRQRALAIAAYQGQTIDPAPEGRSEVNDWTVFETVQWILPSLTRIFAAGDDIVEFEPTGPEDEDIAKQESEVLNYLVTQKNNWFLTCLQWFQDALITKNAYCMASMEEKQIPETEYYEGQSEEQLAMLVDDGMEIVEAEAREDEDNPQPVIGPDGQPMIGPEGPLMQPRIIYDVTVKRVKTTKRLRFDVLPPERCIIGEDTPDFTLAECNYFEYFDLETISDLRKCGYEIDDDIGFDGVEWSEEDAARDDILGADSRNRELDLPDPSMRQVVVRTIWIRYDYDDDGIAELQKVVRVGNTILERESASCIPVSSIVPFLNTHRHMGTSVADLTFDIQRIKTAMLRSGLDSLYLATNPRHVISDKVTLDDMLISRPGGVVRLKQHAIPGEGHVMPLQTENTFPYVQQGLLHMDTVTESRVGVNRMFQGIDDSNLNDHNRIGQLSTMAAQRVEQIARIFANGVERLFSIAHELVIKSGHSMDAIKLRGQWIDINPTQWRTGRDMRVVAPFAAGNKDSLIQRLMLIRGIHSEAAAAGHPMVQPDDSYALAMEISKASDVAGDKFFTDPSTVPPPQPPPDHTMMALEIENKKVDNEAVDEERKAELDRAKIATDAELDKYKADLNAQVQIALAQLKAGQAVDLERVRAGLKETPIEVDGKKINFDELGAELKGTKQQASQMIGQAMAKIRQLDEELNAPREVVRENGKVTGVKIGGKFKPLKRDADGKVIGV